MLIIDPSDTGKEKIASVVEEAGDTAVLTAVCLSKPIYNIFSKYKRNKVCICIFNF